MSEEKQQESGPAIEYIRKELAAAKVERGRAKWFGLFLTVFICGYFGGLTWIITDFLKPKTVAEIATGEAIGLIEANATPLAQSLEKETRSYLHSIPDQLIERMPSIREQFEQQLLTFARNECRNHASTMGDQLVTFLERNSEAVTEFLEAADDKEAIAKLADELSQEFVDTLEVRPEGSSESLSEKIKLTLDALERAEKQLERLARNEKLTPKETDQRRAIAVIARAAEESL